MTDTVSNQQLQDDLKAFAPGLIAPYEPAADDSRDYGPKDKELPETLQEELREMCRRFSEQGRWARRIEVQNRRRNRLYWQGIQRLAWNWKDFQFQIPYSGPSTPSMQSSEAAERPPILDTTNIYQRDGRSITAVLAQNSPNVRFDAEDPTNELDIRTSATAVKMQKFIERGNNMPDKRIDLNRLLWTDGRVVGYTRYVVDAQKYGKDKEDNPRGQEQIEWFGVLEARVPITANDQSEMPYMDLSKEEDVTTLQAMYPDCASKIEPGTAAFGEDEYDRIARLSVRLAERLQVLAGDTYTHLATHKRVWLRPSAFASVSDVTRRKQLFEMFPDGCKVVFAGTAFCRATNVSMDDELAIVRPLPGDGQDTPALGDLEISVQDRVNDLYDITMEAFEMGLPVTWVDQKAVDLKAIQQQKSEFGAHQGVDRMSGGTPEPMQNYFFREEAVEPGAAMMKHAEDLFGPVPQSLTGNLPSLFGGDMQDQKTAKGYQLAKAAAMGQLGIVWQRLKTFYAKVMLQAVRCGAKHRSEDIILNEGDKQTEIALADLKGKIQCYPVTDESFPDSWADKRATFMMLVQEAGTNPMFAKLLMDNQDLGKNLLGLPELRVAGSDSEQKAIADIADLLNSVPIPGDPQPDPRTGQPAIGPDGQPASGPPKSSMPVDPVYDDPATEFPIYQQWIRKEGRAVKIAKPDGWLNVYLRGKELFTAIQQAQQEAQQQQVAMVAAAHPPKPVAPQVERGPSESISLKDVPTPAGKAQLLAKGGIQVHPADIAVEDAQNKAAEAAAKVKPPVIQ